MIDPIKKLLKKAVGLFFVGPDSLPPRSDMTEEEKKSRVARRRKEKNARLDHWLRGD